MQETNTASLGSKLTYKIYTVTTKDGEQFNQSIDQAIQPDCFFVWQPHVFVTNSRYKVEVFNDANKLLCSKSFELIAGK